VRERLAREIRPGPRDLHERELEEHATPADDEPLSEEDVFALLKETFDAEEVEAKDE